LQISGVTFAVTYPHRVCLFRVLLDACPFSYLQYTALPTCCKFSLIFLEFMWGDATPPLSCGACHTLATVTSLPLSKHTGGGSATPTCSSQLVYL
jgi:hypothetical protein